MPGKLQDVVTHENTKVEVWNPRPLFLWKGSWQRLEVYAYGETEPLWSHALEPKQENLLYGAEAELKPNKNGYYWQLIPAKVEPQRENTESQEENSPPRKAFRIMEKQKSQRVSKALAQLEIDGQGTTVAPKQIALRQVHFFMQENLGSDLLHTIYRNPHVASEWKTEFARKKFCTADQETVARL